MTDKNNHIKCPGCGNEIDVQSLLYDEIKNDFNRTRQEELIEERRAMRETIKTQLEEEQSSATEAMQQELAENSKKLKKLHKLRADLAKAKREKEEMSENLNAEAEEKYGILLAKARQDIEKKEKDGCMLKFIEVFIVY